MVVIPIRAPIVNLIVTVICLVFELAFLTACFWTFQFITCRRLLQKQSIHILSQKRIAATIALSATLMFVALETLISIFSEASMQTFVSREKCVRNTALGIHTDDAYETEGEVIHYGCTTVHGSVITHHVGNYSLQTGNLECGEQPLYSYVIGERQDVSREEGVSECDNRVCSVVALRKNVLYISEWISSDDTGNRIPAMLTDVTPLGITNEDLEGINKVTMDGYVQGIQEESDIRRRALAAPMKTQCDFRREGKQSTTIPLSIVIISIIVWLASILFFVVCFRFKNHIFFNWCDPIHWASLTWHDVEAAQGNDPKVDASELGGCRRIRISRYM